MEKIGGWGLGVGAAAAAYIATMLTPWITIPSAYTTVGMVGGSAFALLDFISRYRDQYEKLFLNCNLFTRTISDTIILPYKMRTIRKNNGKDIIFSLPQGLCLDDFKLKEPHISQALNKKVTFDYNNGIIIMSVKDNQLKHTYPFTPIHTEKPLEIVLGYSHDGILTLPLDSSPSPHFGVFGETNGGKSVIVCGIIVQLMLDKSPDDLEMYLIDPKRVEFKDFENSEFVKAYSRDNDEIISTLRTIVAETDRRYKLLEDAGVKNIREYNKISKLKYILVVVDEYADIADDDSMNNMVNYIARKARAVGIHLILACQRPDKDILNGKIKANIGNILGLKTTTQVNSRVIIDKEGLETLRGFGHGILKQGSKYTEMQSMLIETDEIKQKIKHTLINKKLKEQNKARGWLEVGSD